MEKQKKSRAASAVPAEKRRVGLIDEVRGFAILCMVVYHAAFNLNYMLGVPVPLFFNPVMDVVRDLFAGLFIFISGTACRFSRNNLKRGLICFSLGMGLTLFTYLFVYEERIVFGILHMLGLAMLFYGLFHKVLDRLSPVTGLVISALLCLLTYKLPDGYLTFLGLFRLELPQALYGSDLFAFLGFHGPHFFSSDYFPLFPWLFCFIAGSYAGKPLRENKFPPFFYRTHMKALAFIGRHTLIIYILHQPVLYGIVILLSMLGIRSGSTAVTMMNL